MKRKFITSETGPETFLKRCDTQRDNKHVFTRGTCIHAIPSFWNFISLWTQYIETGTYKG